MVAPILMSLLAVALSSIQMPNAWAADDAKALPYSEKLLSDTRAKNPEDLIVLHFHAAWCPVCRKQSLVLKKIIPDAKFKDVHFIAANYDTDTDLNKKYGVTDQSTFVAFRGKEKGDPKKSPRSSFVTDEEAIRAFIAKELENK